jgi:hypothetical protein
MKRRATDGGRAPTLHRTRVASAALVNWSRRRLT